MSDKTNAESETWTKLDTTEQSWTNLDTTSLSVSAAAQMLGVSDKTLRRWDASGVLVPVRSPTGRRIYTREAIDALRKSQGLSEFGNRQPQSPMVADDVDGAIDRITSSIDAGALTDEQRARIIQAASRLQQTVSEFQTGRACNVAVETKDEDPSKPRNGLLFDDEPVGAPPAASRGKAVDEDFERFWKVFPRRVNKSKAREAFDRAFKKLRAKLSAEECVRTILDGAKVYAERANPEMLCHPTTWLNGGRWDDDPDGIWAGERPKGSAGVTLGRMTKEMAEMSFEDQLRLARGY